MTDLNSVFLIGRLTRDVEVAYLQTGTAIGKFSLAVNRSVKKNGQWTDEVNFFDVACFGKTAENLKPYLLKGKMIGVQGSLKQDRWEKDGQHFSRVSVVAENIQLCGSSGSNTGNSSNNQSAYAQEFKQQETTDFQQEITDFGYQEDEDIEF